MVTVSPDGQMRTWCAAPGKSKLVPRSSRTATPSDMTVKHRLARTVRVAAAGTAAEALDGASETWMASGPTATAGSGESRRNNTEETAADMSRTTARTGTPRVA
ncbi:hypothetical protein GCM10010430_71660 [Kitasatospora cystarginea]|uniref:Uncharacterized protein n=1 Tax=Kitasatospora cystarginea TaxID=58350 RepID=A0ABN3EWU6_9ACTN